MSTRKDGGKAFPYAHHHVHSGMSLRDWFAGQALPTVVSLIGIPEDGPDDLWNAALATQAYGIADAMLKVREGGAP